MPSSASSFTIRGTSTSSGSIGSSSIPGNSLSIRRPANCSGVGLSCAVFGGSTSISSTTSPFKFLACLRPFLLSFLFLPARVRFFPGLLSSIGTPSRMSPSKVPATLLTSCFEPFAGFFPAATASFDTTSFAPFLALAFPPLVVLTSKSISFSEELFSLSDCVSVELSSPFFLFLPTAVCFPVFAIFSFKWMVCGLLAFALACTL